MLREKAIEESREEGRGYTFAEIIWNMNQNHFTLDQIALATQKSVGEIQDILNQPKPTAV